MSDTIYQSEEAGFTAFCGVQSGKRRSLQITPLNGQQYVQLNSEEVKELIKALIEEYI